MKFGQKKGNLAEDHRGNEDCENYDGFDCEGRRVRQPLPPQDRSGPFVRVNVAGRTVRSSPHLHRTSTRTGRPWVPSLR